jgi:hypothetical protein
MSKTTNKFTPRVAGTGDPDGAGSQSRLSNVLGNGRFRRQGDWPFAAYAK